MTASALETQLNDPLLHDIALPLSATYYPLGFAVEIATNSQDVLEAARESWERYARTFDTAPVHLRMVVEPAGGLAPEPKFRAQRRSVMLVADRDNFGMCDAARRRGFCFVAAATVSHRAWFRWHFLEAMAYVLLAQEDVVPVHAACVALNHVGQTSRSAAGLQAGPSAGRNADVPAQRVSRSGRLPHGATGVLLCGASGSGKSTLAFACARAGWQYVGDDAAWLLAPDGDEPSAVGRCHQVRLRGDAPRLFPELAGYVAEPRPHGRVAIEAPLADFPEIAIAPRCRVGGLVLLERRSGAAALAQPMLSDEIIDRLIADMPSYGPEVTARYLRTARRLRDARSYRLQYDDLDGAVKALSDLFQS